VHFSNGLDGIWVDPDDFASTPAKTYRHYTVRSGDVIEFGAAVPVGVTVTIDYNISSYSTIGCDTSAPYTVEWTIPARDDSDATHYDISAAFSPEGFECEESVVSEGFQLPFIDLEGSEFLVHGIDDIDNNGDIDLNDNMPGNALCVSQGLGFDNDDPTGTQVNKLSGDWAEFFVTTEEADIEQVKMIVYHTFDLNAADSDTCMMTENPLEADPPQPVHKVLYESDFPTLDPDRVENVTITVSGYASGPSERTFAMYDDGVTGDDLVANDGHWTALLSLDPGNTYDYSFTIDLVGGDFINTSDPRHDESQIQIPSVAYWWCSARLDDDHLLHQNAINHVHVEVTDSEGNVTDNLSENNQGQIDVILDRVAPTVAALSIDRAQVAPGGDVEVFATITDPSPADINVITVTEVLFQVSPDASRDIWLDWFSDSDPSDGWGGLEEWSFDPTDDNIDNDQDGTFDEADESGFAYWIRAVAIDDCHNHGYSDRQEPPVVVPVTVDTEPPACKLAEPTNGSIHSIGSTITLTTAPSTDTDVLYVSFQYDAGDGWMAIDATPVDDTDELDGFDGEHTPATVKNEDGTYSITWNTAFLTETDFYVRLRCVARDIAGNFSGNGGPFDTGEPPIEYVTIIMNDDTAPLAALTHVADVGPAYILKSIVDPTLAINDQVLLIGVASGGQNGDVATVQLQYSTNNSTWLDAGVTNVLGSFFVNEPQENFFIMFNTIALGLADGPVWLRVVAVDHDGNLQGDANHNGVLESNEVVPGVVKVTVDNSEPAMWITQVGPVFGSPVPDHTLIQYDLWPREVMRGSQFETDSDLRLADDLTFQAADPNDGSVDVLNATFLQFYDDWTDQEHPTWQPAFPPIPEIDADNNGVIDESEIEDFVGNLFDYNYAFINFLENADDWRFAYRDDVGNNAPPGPPQDGRWYLQFGSIGALKDAMNDAAGGIEIDGKTQDQLKPAGFGGGSLPDKEYQFRALAIDYAGNANTAYAGHTLRIDSTDPVVEEIFAGNNETEGGGGGGIQITPSTVQVAGGDEVPLAALVYDDFPVSEGPRKGQLTPNGVPLPGTDSESSGIWGVRFEYQAQAGDDGVWHNIGLGTFNAETNLWEIDWTTPENRARGTQSPQADDGSSTTDSLYAIRATAVDSAGNVGDLIREDAVNVQDHTPPDDTEIVDINGSGEGDCTGTYPPNTNEETVRAPDGTWVRGTVEMIAATQYGDPSMFPGYSENDDVFSPTVFFEARPVGTNDWTVIGTSTEPIGGGFIESAPGVTALQSHLGPHWIVYWNTLQLNGNGDRIWNDGMYEVRAWGRDVWGNTELLEVGEAPLTVKVTIDNTPPEAAVDADPATTIRDVEADVERNDPDGYTILVRTTDNNEGHHDPLLLQAQHGPEHRVGLDLPRRGRQRVR
jgi:hypothetical protein